MYKVYVLPKEKYCGVTKRLLSKRLWEHKNKGKNIDDAFIICEFESKKEAFVFETEYQLKNGYKGYTFNYNWRLIQSKKCLLQKPSDKLKNKVQCIETGEIYESSRECERIFYKKSGNLSKHLKGHPQHKTFNKLTFKYYEQD